MWNPISHNDFLTLFDFDKVVAVQGKTVLSKELLDGTHIIEYNAVYWNHKQSNQPFLSVIIIEGRVYYYQWEDA